MLIAIVCLAGFWVLLNAIGVAWTHRKGNHFWVGWVVGLPPTEREFKGAYKITMYPRWLWWWFIDKKVFYEEDRLHEDGKCYYSNTWGLNVAFGIFAWGKRLLVVHYDRVTVLEYTRAWWPWCIIEDSVRKKMRKTKGSPNWYVGKFCVKLPVIGKIHLAWFNMEKL